MSAVIASLPQEISTLQAVQKAGSSGIYGLLNRVKQCFSVDEDLRIAKVYLRILTQLEELRPLVGTGTFTQQDKGEFGQLIRASAEFIDELKGRHIRFVWPRSKDYLALAHTESILKLQLQSLRRVFAPESIEKPLQYTSEVFDQRKKVFDLCCRLCLKRAKSTVTLRIDREEVVRLQDMASELPKGSIDKLRFESALDDYISVRNQAEGVLSSEYLSRDSYEGIADDEGHILARNVLKDYSDYVPYLLEDKVIQELFFKQVVMTRMDLDVFFCHPLVVCRLQQTEYMNNSIYHAGDRVRVSKESGLPEMRVANRWVSVRSIPGFLEGTLVNNLGWRSLGLAYDVPHCSLSQSADKLQAPNGYVYTSAEGLIQWNPRAWTRRIAGRWQEVDLNRRNWWHQLPPYAIETITKQDESDRGWRLRTVITHSSPRIQLKGTHSYVHIVTPVEDQDGVPLGCVKVAHFPFGEFAYPHLGMAKVLKSMHPEVHYIDMNLGYGNRGKTTRDFRISQESGLNAFEQIRKERLSNLEECRNQLEATFNIIGNNCTSFFRRVTKAAGVVLPIRSTMRSATQSRALKVVIVVLQRVPYFFRSILYLFGMRGKGLNWDYVVDGPFVVRKYLQLLNETEEMRKQIALRSA